MTEKGERLYIDLIWMKTPSGGDREYWCLVVDEVTAMTWNYFLRTKTELASQITQLIRKLQGKKLSIRYIRCDNGGENMQLEQECEKEKMNIKFEYTPRETPQHNGVVERKFQTYYNRLRDTLHRAGLPIYIKKRLWTEAAQTVTMLDNITVKQNENQSPYEKFYNEKSKIINELRTFGEVGVVKQMKDSIKTKLSGRGKCMLFIGYSLSHGTKVYRMYNIETNKLVISQDIVWLNKSYGEWNNEGDEESITQEEQESPDEDVFWFGDLSRKENNHQNDHDHDQHEEPQCLDEDE